MTGPTKVCSRCHQLKPLDDFKTDVRKPDGKASACKACVAVPRVGEMVASNQLAVLVPYDHARLMLAEAKAVDDVKDILDRAVAMKKYAERAADRTLEIDATEIRFFAERRLGEMIAAQKETVGLNRGRAGAGRPVLGAAETEAPKLDPRPTLAEAGIDHKLSSHAQKMAAVPEQEFQSRIDAWRDEMAAGQTRVTMDLMRIGEAEQKKKTREARERVLGEMQCALPQKRFGVILADPEWRFEPYSRETGMDRAADNHYPTSETDVICARPVQAISADDCALFLWATVPMLTDALRVMTAWGFEYKSHLVWKKDRLGTGYWFRNQHELLLLGTRGDRLPAPAMGTQFPSLIEAPVGDHSEKPDVIYEIIERYFPNLPKIELNARRARPGWDAWGNEAPANEAAA